MANPLKGKEVREVISARMEPSKKKALIKKFGSLQAAVDALVAMAVPENKKLKKEKSDGQG